MCTLTPYTVVNVRIVPHDVQNHSGRGTLPRTRVPSRARPRCKPSGYAGASSDECAAATDERSPDATSRTASTNRSASDSSL
jgi:hypothetical protein